MENKIENKKTEVRTTTSDISEMFGNYVAEHVCRKWTEDFIDEDTGELVSIDRSEILLSAGTYIDRKVQTEINFFLQCGDIKEVIISNQSRLAKESKLPSMGTWFANIEVANKKHKIILHANCIEAAIEVLRDFVELNFAGAFQILQLKTFDNCTTLADNLVKLEMTEEGVKEEEEEEKLNKKFYKIVMGVDIDGFRSDMLYLVHGKDVESSTALIENHINELLKERAEKSGEEVPVAKFSLEAVSQMPCSAIIDKDFCLAYAED